MNSFYAVLMSLMLNFQFLMAMFLLCTKWMATGSLIRFGIILAMPFLQPQHCIRDWLLPRVFVIIVLFIYS